jgi:V/A-type H+-transporting ATPase subunit A
VTLISAVSPPSGDFSEPVTQACLRVAGALWALDPELAHQRQFPAVDTGTSYSLYTELTLPWFAAEVDARWGRTRAEVLALLQRDSELREIASVVGLEALEDGDRLVLAASSLVRETVLGQSAFDPNDASCPPDKTHRLARGALDLLARGREALAAGATFAELDLGPARRALAALRDAPSSEAGTRAEEAARRIASVWVAPPTKEAPG